VADKAPRPVAIASGLTQDRGQVATLNGNQIVGGQAWDAEDGERGGWPNLLSDKIGIVRFVFWLSG
jgi:hypothetical protein